MIVLKRWNNDYNQYTHDKNRHDYKHVLSLKKKSKIFYFYGYGGDNTSYLAGENTQYKEMSLLN